MCCWRVSECKLGSSTVELWHTLLVRAIKQINTFSTLWAVSFFLLPKTLVSEVNAKFVSGVLLPLIAIVIVNQNRACKGILERRSSSQACTVRNDDSRNETRPLLISHFLWTAKTTDMDRERNKCVNSVWVHSLLAHFVTVDCYNCVETAAMLVYQPNSVGVELFSLVSKHLLLFWPC